MKFYKSYIQYKRNGKIIVEQLGDSIYPFKGRYTSLYYQIEMGKNEYKLYGYWQISSNEIECDTIIINKMNYGNELNKWVRCEEGLTYSRYTLKGHEDLGLVIATTKFINGDKQLYVYKSIENKSFLFMVKEGDTWSTLSYIPEEVINNMVGTIIIGDKVY